MEMAQLLEHTLEERAAQVVAAEKKKKAKKEAAEEAEAKALEEQAGVAVALGASAAVVGVGAPAGGPQMPDDVRRFMIKMREGGAQASPEELFTMMRGFKDNVTLDHLYRFVACHLTDALSIAHTCCLTLTSLRFSIACTRTGTSSSRWPASSA